MRKLLFVISLIAILLFFSYTYYESKRTEVFLVGDIVGFNIDVYDYSNEPIINTSSGSVGTLTFIKSNYEFAALGHSIAHENLSSQVNCYNVEFKGIKISTKNNIGSIVATIDENSKLGYLAKNSNFGVFGTIENISDFDCKKISTQNRYNINKGLAYVLIDFDGTGLKEYEIEIMQLDYFSPTKNIKFIVKSQDLLQETGGIVSGMSGAPIIQNGMLIGAINSVNSMNPLDAYGIFIDKLI